MQITDIAKPVSDDEEFYLKPALRFILMHVTVMGLFLVGFSWQGLILCAVTYYVRMAGITVGYHRYFAHRSFRTSRIFQFILAWIGACAAQRGPLWWAGTHRIHHNHADQDGDPHSPSQRGVLWAHLRWFLCPKYQQTPARMNQEFPLEIQWLDRNCYLPPFILAVFLLIGWGLTGLFWGFFLSTVLVWHATFCVNSVMHLVGSRRYPTDDTSRNVWWLSLVTLGENWHNNHHHYETSAKQGFFWFEIDIGYYLIRIFSLLGLVSKVRMPPERVLKKQF